MTAEFSRRNFLETAGGLAAAAAVTAAALGASAAEAGEPKRIKILGICGSPRKGKTTATALGVCLEAAQGFNSGIETELIELAGLKIPGEVAAGLPLEEGQKDDFPALVPKLSDPRVGGIIIGTPVYFGNMSSLCKAFLERCVVFPKNKTPLNNKVAGVLAVGGGRNGGQELTIRSVQAALMSQQLIVVGDAPPTGHWGGNVWAGAGGPKADVTADEYGMASVKNLGRRVAEIALLLARRSA